LVAFIHQLVGGVLVVGGAILAPTPIPVGLLMLTTGLVLLAPYSPQVQRVVRASRRKWPKVDAALARSRARMPDFVKAAIDKTTPAP
jgi:hypothetical protein